jgi:hypothetical protein
MKNSLANARKFNNGWKKPESFIFFFINVEEPHSFVKSLNGEDPQHWKKAMDFKF